MNAHTFPRMDGGGSQPLRSDQVTLSMVQQPERGKVVSRGKERDRKSIDPPPVVRLDIRHDQVQQLTGCPSWNNPYLFCSVTLWKPSDDEPKRPESRDSDSSDEKPSPKPSLYGSTVSSLHRLKDLTNDEAGFFVFGDVSAGCAGPARLKFSVYELFPASIDQYQSVGQVVHLASILSDKFEVANAKDWDGVKESTALSRSFADQGVRLRLRKESRAATKRSFGATQAMQPQPLRPITSQTQGFDPSNQNHDDMPNGKRQRTNMSFPGYNMPMSTTPYSMPISSSAQYNTSGTYGTTQGYTGNQQPYSSSNAMYPSNQQYGYNNGNGYARSMYTGNQYQGNQSQYAGTNASSTPPTQYAYDGVPFSNANQYANSSYGSGTSAQSTASYMSQQQTPSSYTTQPTPGSYQSQQNSVTYPTVQSPFAQQAQQPRLPPIHQVPVGQSQVLQYAEA